MLLPGQPRRPALLALALLFGVNFLNYIDRYIIAAVAPLIQADFHLNDNQIGWAMSIFMAAYVVISPFSGVLGDRWPRRYLVGLGVVLWSLATAASGMATGFVSLLVARSFIGVGEAGFGVVAPTIISDLFTREARGRMLAFFYVAIPVGSALGYLLGGFVGTHFGWRAAFLVAGIPGSFWASWPFACTSRPAAPATASASRLMASTRGLPSRSSGTARSSSRPWA